MKSYIFILVFLSFFIFSCSRNVTEKQISAELQPISIKEGEIEKLTEEDVVNSIHFVRLETTEDCLIDKIEQIQRHKGCTYILDAKENLFVFDEYGKFVRKIGQKGPGPEGYTGAHMFYIHPKKQYIAMISLATRKVVRYDLEGNYLDRLSLELKSRSLFSGNCYLMDKNTLLLECSNGQKFAPYQYLCVDEKALTEKNAIFTWPALGEKNESFPYPKNNNAGKEHYIISYCNDTIYKYENGTISPRFILESGLKHPTSEVVKEYAPYRFIDEAQKKLNQNGYSMGLGRVFSTDNHLCLEYFGLGYCDYIFWNRHKKEGYLYRLLESNNPLLHIYNELRCADEKFLVRWLPIEMFFVAEKEIRATNHPGVPELYKNLKEEDNPVLVLYDYDKLLSRFK
ncbi:6-bladed beta-propeller [Parabacteroides goldsteinii]|jgi:hypothetical protein|uniref:6-bladed beta-propeller n=1 Tax=Parabacteroides goldsteinii TaxID=328812 RepID=UPI00249000C6|nr:6-bladed beta-propeller [Parabacteroides goldsteinii]